MSFGGSVSAMLTSLKNNKRSRPNTLKKLKNFENGSYKKGTIDKKASPELLKRIREKTRKEYKNNLIKNVIVVSVIALAFFLILWFS